MYTHDKEVCHNTYKIVLTFLKMRGNSLGIMANNPLLSKVATR